jgi:hypothetical protein
LLTPSPLCAGTHGLGARAWTRECGTPVRRQRAVQKVGSQSARYAAHRPSHAGPVVQWLSRAIGRGAFSAEVTCSSSIPQACPLRQRGRLLLKRLGWLCNSAGRSFQTSGRCAAADGVMHT